MRFSEMRQQSRVTRKLLNQTALETFLLKKEINITHAVFGILHGTTCHIRSLGVHLAEQFRCYYSETPEYNLSILIIGNLYKAIKTPCVHVKEQKQQKKKKRLID